MTNVVVIGAGYAGVLTAKKLEKRLRKKVPDQPESLLLAGAALAVTVPCVTVVVTALILLLAGLIHPYFQFAVIRYKEAAVRLVDSDMAYNCNLIRTLSLICTAGKMFECVFVKQMNEFVR